MYNLNQYQPKNSICNDFHQSRIYSVLKYALVCVKLAGFHISSECFKNVVGNIDLPAIWLQQSEETGQATGLITQVEAILKHGAQNVAADVSKVNIFQDNGYRNHNFQNVKQKILAQRAAITVKPKTGDFKVRSKFGDDTIGKTERLPCSCRHGSFVKCLRIVLCSLVTSGIVLDIARLVFVLFNAAHNDDSFVYMLANLSFRCLLLFLNMTGWYVSGKHFLPMCYAWLRYEQRYGLKMREEKFARWFWKFIMVAVSLTMTVMITIVVGILTSVDDTSFQVWPFDMSITAQRYTATIIFGLSTFLGCCCVFGSHVLRGSIMFVILEELENLQKKMLEIVSNKFDPVRAEEEFDKFVEQLRVLNTIIERCFDVVKHVIAAAYVFTPILMCLVLYDIASDSMKWNQKLLTGYTVVIVVFMIAGTTSICGRLRTKLAIFTQQMSVDEIGFSVYGMFTVDYSSLLMVGGTVLTYGIFVLQLKLEDKSPVICKFINMTK